MGSDVELINLEKREKLFCSPVFENFQKVTDKIIFKENPP